MAAISTSGLISGIDTDALTTKLLALDAAPVSLLQTRITSDQTLGSAYAALGTSLSSLQTTAQSLETPQAFGDTTATSSDPASLTATTTTGAAAGTYTLRVARTVSTQQLVSAGFVDATSTAVGAGTITIGRGSGGNLATQTTLAQLNGGAGAARGQFRITDRSGASAVIDTSSAVSLDDVVADINTATNVSVRASVSGNHLVLADTSGKTTSNLIVQDLGTGTSAASLGITGSVAATTLTGTAIDTVGESTLLASLNDGRGVTLGTGGASGDFTVHLRSGATFTVNLAGVTTVGGAIAAINAAAGTNAKASLSTAGNGLTLTDSTVGLGTLSVTANNGSQAAAGLGLTAPASGATITGSPVLAGIDTTLLSTLNGGQGVTLGSIKVTDAAGTAHTVNLAAATDVQGVLTALNAGSGGKFTAALNASGTGVKLTDASGGTGTLAVTPSGTATALGLTGPAAAGGVLSGTTLDKQWLTGSTLLSSLDGGLGIGAGTFTVTTAAGASATVTVGAGTTTVSQLLYQINSKGLPGLTAKVNATGNGIELTDASGGAGHLTVADTTGSAAAALNIQGTATGTTLDGAYSKTITVGRQRHADVRRGGHQRRQRRGVGDGHQRRVDHGPLPPVGHGRQLRHGRGRHARRRVDRAGRADAGRGPGRGRVRRRGGHRQRQQRVVGGVGGRRPAAAGDQRDRHGHQRDRRRQPEPAGGDRRDGPADRLGRPLVAGQVADDVHDDVQRPQRVHRQPVDVQRQHRPGRAAAGRPRWRWT